MAEKLPEVLHASLGFLEKLPVYEDTKPYRLFVDPTNEVIEQRRVAIRDIRGHEDEFSIEKNGFAILRFQPPSYQECVNSKDRQMHPNIKHEPIAGYTDMLAEEVKAKLGAEEAVVIEYRYRRSHPEYPVAPEED